MNVHQNTWAIVLAAGDGARLASLTSDQSGCRVPKQFCSLEGGLSLLNQALTRARRVITRDQTCVIVAADHERYWRDTLRTLRQHNVIVQPRNRGTAAGVLISLLSVLEQDPLAHVLFLPADHYVRCEPVLARALREVVGVSHASPDAVILVGMHPEGPDSELGYIVPSRVLRNGSHQVEAFVEKPDTAAALALLAAGAMWNSFIFAASGAFLLRMMRDRLGTLVEHLESAFAKPRGDSRWRTLHERYESLPTIDFSRAVIQGGERVLRVVRAPACGWNDLGTPKRLADISALYRVQLSVPELRP